MTQPTAHLWTIRNGKAIRLRSYWERSDALDAAGLSEWAMSREKRGGLALEAGTE